MNLIFDKRVLIHKTYTGVENYVLHLLNALNKKITLNSVEPKISNKYFAHLWTHIILAFKRGNILFCPANIAPLFVPKSKKLLLTLHDVSFQTYPKSFSSFFRIYYKFIVPINCRRADKIITVSNYSKKEILTLYPFTKNKIEVIYLGFDPKFKQLNLKKKNQILYVGSLNERKNFVGVLKSFLSLKNKDISLLIVGNFFSNFLINEETENLLKSVQEHKNIIFKSNVSNNELIKLYNESKLFLFPSFYEGFGLPVLEAMACGTPVITSNVSSLPEVGGDAVLYCNPNDIVDIKEKIELLLEDENLQKSMIKNGLERVKKFTWEKAADNHIEIFEEVLKS